MRDEKIPEYDGGCLCNETTFTARGEHSNPICAHVRCVKNPLERQPLLGLNFLWTLLNGMAQANLASTNLRQKPNVVFAKNVEDYSEHSMKDIQMSALPLLH